MPGYANSLFRKLLLSMLLLTPYSSIFCQMDSLSSQERADIDMGMETPLINTSPGSEYADDKRHFALATGITVTPGGKIWVAWFAGGDSEKAFLLATSSDDNGDTWATPRFVIDPSDGELFDRRTLVGNIWTDPQGRMRIFFDQSMGFFDGRGGVWTSVTENPDADSPEWSTPKRIWHGANLNKPTVLANGDWLLPVSLWDKSKIRSGDAEREKGLVMNKELFPELDPLRRANVFRSRDEGNTWERLGGVALPWTDYDEHMIIEKRDASLWMLARTGMGIYESFSFDDGENWTEAVPSKSIAHIGSRFFITRLHSGNLLLVKHGRGAAVKSTGRNDLTAFLSRDDGKTWEGGLLLDDRYSSYPDGFQSKDGMIYITYDHARESAAEILMARFREEDILTGKFKSPNAKGRILVNKATGPKPQAPGRAIISPQLKEDLDLALQPPLINTSPSSEYGDHKRNFALTTGIAGTPGGRLWAAWFSEDSEHSYLLAASSDDRGNTWTQPRLVIDPADGQSASRRTLVGNFWTDPRGHLWLFFDQSLAFFDGRGGVWSTVCENPDAPDPQWSTPQRIWHGATLNKPTIISSGEWLLPVSLWDKSKIKGKDIIGGSGFRNNLFPELDVLRKAHVFTSVDEGKTWKRTGGVSFPSPDFDEHSIIERKDGSLWMLGRTSKGIFESVSGDKGKTWSKPQPSRIQHPNTRFFITRLQSGNLLLVKHGKTIESSPGRFELTAFISKDDGETWDGGLTLDERFTSYPDGFQATDGTIFVSYDHERAKDAEILLARFSEDDVLAGKFHTPEATSRLLINQASGKPKSATSSQKGDD